MRGSNKIIFPRAQNLQSLPEWLLGSLVHLKSNAGKDKCAQGPAHCLGMATVTIFRSGFQRIHVLEIFTQQPLQLVELNAVQNRIQQLRQLSILGVAKCRLAYTAREPKLKFRDFNKSLCVVVAVASTVQSLLVQAAGSVLFSPGLAIFFPLSYLSMAKSSKIQPCLEAFT